MHLITLHAQRGEIDLAVDDYKRAAEVARNIGHLYRETLTLINIASLYEQKEKVSDAKIYFERAWKLAKEQDYFDHLASFEFVAMLKNTAVVPE